MKNNVITLLAVAITVVAPLTSTAALTFVNDDYDSSRHDIDSPSFFLKDFDFGGIGWSFGRGITAIDPSWAIGATGHQPGNTVTFVSGEESSFIDQRVDLTYPDGTTTNYMTLYHFLTPLQNTPTYQMINFPAITTPSLAFPIFDGIYDFIYTGFSDDTYTGLSAGFNENKYPNLASGSTFHSPLIFNDSATDRDPDTVFGGGWDEGMPSFLVVNGVMYLAGVHDGSTQDSGIVWSGEDIEAKTGLDDLYVMYADAIIPEPSTLLLGLAGVSCIAFYRRRK